MRVIVDTEMPKRCFDCPMHDYVSDRSSSLPSVVRPVCNAHHELKPIPNGDKRPDWCPICGVLPDEHGDLIDRDTLKKEISVLQDTSIIPWQKAREYAEIAKSSTLNIIDDQHAVIKAERKDNEK